MSEENLTLSVVVRGEVVQSNLPEFTEAVRMFIGAINRDLQTDEEFGQAELDVKKLATLEDGIKKCKTDALAQAESLNALFRQLDQSDEAVRAARLDLEKKIKLEKDSRKARLVTNALNSLGYPAALRLKKYGTIIENSIKGKRSLEAMETALNQIVGSLNESLVATREVLQAHKNSQGTHLIPDEVELLSQPAESVKLMLENRVVKYQADEAKKKADAQLAQEQSKAAAELQKTKADADRRIAEANAAAMSEPEQPLPFSTPTPVAPTPVRQAANAPTPADEWDVFTDTAMNALSSIRPARVLLKKPENIARAQKFANTLLAAWNDMTKGGAA